jgi:hypothetical protein
MRLLTYGTAMKLLKSFHQPGIQGQVSGEKAASAFTVQGKLYEKGEKEYERTNNNQWS